MLLNYTYTDAQVARAEEMIPSMSYTALLDNLIWLSDLGVLAPGNPVSMLVVARLVDRTRLRRSGVTRQRIEAALEAYRVSGSAVVAVVKALEQAIATV